MNTIKVLNGLKSINGTGLAAVRNLSNAASNSSYNFTTLKVSSPHEYVFHVEFNRPEKRNALNRACFDEITKCFEQLKHDSDCRSIVISGKGKGFTSGIDLGEFSQSVSSEEEDIGRRGFIIRKMLIEYQNSMSSLENCHKPVIACVHGHCVGGGIDLISAADIRYCSKDAWFTIKEVDIGLAADIGTLQRFPKIVGNDSLVRELVYTARKFTSEEAKSIGFVSKVLDDEQTLLKEGLELAKLIASKSPIAVQGSKINLIYSRDHTVEDGLKFMSAWNLSMLQSEDLPKAAMASMAKQDPIFSKL